MKATDATVDPTLENQTWKLFSIVGDLTAQRVLWHLCSAPLSAHQLVMQLNLPQTTIYKKLHELEEVGAIEEHHREVSTRGREIIFFTSRVTGLHVEEQDGRVELRVKWRSGAQEVRVSPLERLSSMGFPSRPTLLDCDHPEAPPPSEPDKELPPFPGLEGSEISLDPSQDLIAARTPVRGVQGPLASRRGRPERKRRAVRSTGGTTSDSTSGDKVPVQGDSAVEAGDPGSHSR